MANIKNYIENIRSAIFGKEVRGSLADGLDAINKETENTTSRQKHLENTFDQLIINEGNSNAEIVDARVGENGSSFKKLGDRLDNFDLHLEQKINLNEDIFYNEINIEKKRDEVSGTTYWVTSIPHLDKNGNIIKLKTGVSEYYETHPNRHEDDGTGTDYINNPKLETARNFSIRKKATLVINGGTWGNQGANGNCVVN